MLKKRRKTLVFLQHHAQFCRSIIVVEKWEKPHDIPSSNTSGSHAPSTVSIFEMARAQLLQQTSKKENSSSFTSNMYCGLYPQALEDFELALLLQDCWNVLQETQWSCNGVIKICNFSASSSGTSVQRVVYYFCESLQERIDKEKGTLSPNRHEGWEEKPFDLDKGSAECEAYCSCMLSIITFLPSAAIYWNSSHHR